jgi:hypothetical protein
MIMIMTMMTGVEEDDADADDAAQPSLSIVADKIKFLSYSKSFKHLCVNWFKLRLNDVDGHD